ncbi:unnamed protein product [Hydatigera taeniaeformis]|uniref:HUN domain-containing protein n=1 Tax=Hydatigena taeniaeformis TaxID=6205 RepID=A0A0R3WZV8_HYDTA|nr:unnamed protein product [Hydatigera taeniaeformis]
MVISLAIVSPKMATAAAGTVEAMKRLFENSGNSDSGSCINNHDNPHNGLPHGANGHSNSARNINNQNSYASSVLSFGNASDRSYTDRALGDHSKNKHAPPKVKPKPHVIRKTAPNIQPEPPSKQKTSNDHENVECGVPTKPSTFGSRVASGRKENNGSLSRLPIPPSESGPKHPTLAENDIGNRVRKERTDSAAIPPESSSTRNPSKKPPPVPKKPKSILSGHSNDVLRVHYKYDEALEEQFGLKVDQSSYDFTERWVAFQADRQQEVALNKMKKGENEGGGRMLLNGSPVHSRTSSVSSSTGLSSSNFTNSSIRSILKKGRPSLGIENKKRLTFKDDDELITKYNYPSEESYDDMDSLDRYRSALGSDSDSSSTFDEPEDYDFVDIDISNTPRPLGNKMSESRILFAGSTTSATSSSTLKCSAVQQQKYSSHSPRNNYNSTKNNDITGGTGGNNSSKATTEKSNSSKWSDAFKSSPVLVKPSKSGSKLQKIVCKIEHYKCL